MFFHFTDTLKIGIPQIDAQHKRLVELVEALHVAMSKGAGKSSAPGIVDELVKYAAVHFKDEEALATKHRYPGAVGHKALHDAFTAKVVAFQNSLKAGRTTISLEVALFLKDWLVQHIEREDKQGLGEFLKKKGVKS